MTEQEKLELMRWLNKKMTESYTVRATSEAATYNEVYCHVEKIIVDPRVMTLEELRMNEVYWAEQDNISRPWPIAMHHIRNAGLLDGPVYQDYMGDNYNTKEYGKKWRCWTSRPTDEQRRAMPWES